MMQRFYKKNPLRKAIFFDLPELEKPIFAFGVMGAGKTVTLMSMLQKYHDMPNKKYKIFDLYGGQRNEHNFWCFPSREYKYWDFLNKKLKLKEPGPKQYEVNLLYPCIGEVPDKLPNHPPFIKSKLFTIPFNSLTISDVHLVIGMTSEEQNFQFRELMENINSKSTPADIVYQAKKNIKSVSTFYKNFILPLCEKDHFLQSENHSLNLDVKAEMKDREVISVLCLDFVPKEYHVFIMGWILRQMNVLLDKNKISGKNIVYIREAGEFFKSDIVMVPERIKIFKVQLSDFVRMGRRGVFLLSDCLDKDTKIIANNKNIKIKNLPDKFNVKSYNFKKNKIENDIAVKTYLGKKECFEIILENGKKVIATKEHRFFNEKGKEVYVCNLKKGDKLLTHKEDASLLCAIKIKNIKKIGKRDVYDLSVEKNHNFFLSNKILSHNCQSPSETRGVVSGCISKDTKIQIFKDFKIKNCKISDLPKYFKVFSYDLNNDRLQIKKAKKINTGIKDCFEITLKNGEKILATEEHRFFKKNKGYTEVNKLKKNDFLLFIEKNKTSLFLNNYKKVKNKFKRKESKKFIQKK